MTAVVLSLTLVNNIVLGQLLGTAPFLGQPRRLAGALRMSLALAVVVLLPFRGRAARLLPYALLNCAVLGIGLAVSDTGAAASLAAGLSAGAGYLLASVVFAGLRERLDLEAAPRPMRGLPLDLVTAGLMSLAFLAFDRTLLAALAG